MQEKKIQVKRIYKDSVFRMLFREKEELLSLYNAIYETSYTNPEELEIATLENAIYMGIKNDVSCILDFHLALFEHQSTFNPNIPLRSLMYVSDMFQRLTAEDDIYSSRQIMLPSPSFVVLYNGREEQPERKVLLLSDAYQNKGEEIRLELKVLQLNINPGCNEQIVSKCPTLLEYIRFVAYVRKKIACRHTGETMSVDETVDQAVQECIDKGILKDFLLKNRAEVVKMSIYEYDEEKHMRTLREEGRQEGREEGREEGRQEERKAGIFRMYEKNRTPEEISEFTGESLDYLYKMQQEYLLVREKTQDYKKVNNLS